MIEIALKYSDTKLSSLTFDELVANQNVFETVKCSDPIVNTSEEQGILLNGRKYNHLLYQHKEIEVIISADEIDTDIMAFLQEFWSAGFKYIALNKSGTWGDYVQVMTESGRFPISYIEEIRDLREVSFLFSYAEPEA